MTEYETAKAERGQARKGSFGQTKSKSFADRLGIWMSKRAVSKAIGPIAGRRIADLGCGYHAEFAMQFAGEAKEIVLADIAVLEELRGHSKVTAVLGYLPDSLAERAAESLDVIIANNVVEHLWAPQTMLDRCHELLAPGGVLFVNVPSWRGKWFLEFAAFRLGVSPAEEMNDHKAYYDPRDLWPMLIRAGFIPQDVWIRTHKFGLNTYAIARKAEKR